MYTTHNRPPAGFINDRNNNTSPSTTVELLNRVTAKSVGRRQRAGLAFVYEVLSHSDDGSDASVPRQAASSWLMHAAAGGPDVCDNGVIRTRTKNSPEMF